MYQLGSQTDQSLRNIPADLGWNFWIALRIFPLEMFVGGMEKDGGVFAGHNGAGKTTAISILTGMLQPTSGDAVLNGRSILTDMPSIRADLGCCPQFDILWPEISVLEHLSIYAAIKGFRGQDARDAAAAAAAEVGRQTCMSPNLAAVFTVKDARFITTLSASSIFRLNIRRMQNVA